MATSPKDKAKGLPQEVIIQWSDEEEPTVVNLTDEVKLLLAEKMIVQKIGFERAFRRLLSSVLKERRGQ